MKRLISLLLVLCILFCGALTLASCDEEGDPDEDENGGENNPETNGGTENGGNGGGETGVSTPNTDLTYEEYDKMTPTERRAHYDSFENADAFYAWLNAAFEKWQEDQDREEITDNDKPVEID